MGRGAVRDGGRFVRGVMTMGGVITVDNITVGDITVGDITMRDVIILFHSISHPTHP